VRDESRNPVPGATVRVGALEAVVDASGSDPNRAAGGAGLMKH